MAYKFIDSIFYFPIKLIKGSEDNISFEINKFRIHYLFSSDYNVDNTFKNIVVQIRITRQQKWNSIIAEGSTKQISEFSILKNLNQSMIKKIRINLFTMQMDSLVLKVK